MYSHFYPLMAEWRWPEGCISWAPTGALDPDERSSGDALEYVFGMARKRTGKAVPSKLRSPLLFLIGLLIAAYGAFVFVGRDFFFDLSVPCDPNSFFWTMRNRSGRSILTTSA